jgi:hypothetical protein
MCRPIQGSVLSWGSRFFSSTKVQTGSGAHPAYYSVKIGGCFSGGKAAGAWKLLVPRLRMSDDVLSSTPFRVKVMRMRKGKFTYIGSHVSIVFPNFN